MADSTVGSGLSSDQLNSKTIRNMQSATLRYATLDTDDISLYSSGSPTHAKRALEAHLKDTDRRIQDASRLGSTLLQQRKDLAARLKDLEGIEAQDEVPEDLRNKLSELEREYNEVGKETARAFLPRAKHVENSEQSVLSASGRESPTKLTAPSRKQRNVSTNRVHDIEFATEISTSLLAQVRQLQAALSEKDEALKGSNSAKAELESELYNLAQRIKRLDESEQRYKDENWNLETRVQDLEAGMKEYTDQETRLNGALKTTQTEKSAMQRELDNLKAMHEKLTEDGLASKKQQETDLHGLRRDVTLHQSENQTLHKKIQELTAQNTELAKAVSYRHGNASATSDREFVTADEDGQDDDTMLDQYDNASPIKGTPRHGMLESETLKSSLNHAHRMIQNLKSNIHREKTEKIELKRMLQDARDELENRRGDGASIGANMARKRKGDVEAAKFKKPARPDQIGASRSSVTEYLEDDMDWEDNDGERTPSKSAFVAAPSILAHRDDPESTDGFETAHERNTTTETESFETVTEGFNDDDSDELTETEGSVSRSGRRPGLKHSRSSDRYSYLSTASTSDDEARHGLQTPPANEGPKYRLRMARGSRRGNRVGDLVAEDSPDFRGQYSPASSLGTPRPVGQSLGDELDALDDDSIGGTPHRLSESVENTPTTMRQSSVQPETPSRQSAAPSESLTAARSLRDTQILVKPSMADASVMTEPWEPERKDANEHGSLRERAGDIIGGALAGIGFDRMGQIAKETIQDPAVPGESAAPAPEPIPVVAFTRSEIMSQATEPIKPVVADPVVNATPQIVDETQKASAIGNKELSVPFTLTRIVSQETVPVVPPKALQHGASGMMSPTPASHFSPSVASEQGVSLSTLDSPDLLSFPGVPLRSEKRHAVLFNGDVPPVAQLAEAHDTVRDESAIQVRGLTVLEQSELSATASQPTVADERHQAAVALNGLDDSQKETTGTRLDQPVAATGLLSGLAIAEFDKPISRAGSSTNATRLADGPLSTVSRTTSATVPPLPENSSIKIAAAASQAEVTLPAPAPAASSSMGPPLMPASAYKASRPRTPSERAAAERTSRDGTTPRPKKGRDGRIHMQSPSAASRRTSVSSFASEIDDRFNLQRGQPMYPGDIEPSTDPRMIQAITQTMIGEYLWKYTRKAGRSETSNTRHRRFFWVHPYTRTLYWSEQDPSTAGRSMLKAKSVAIESVRVITDDNAYPPGLHRKSLVVVTPGREIVFTAPTGQRHETWFNALSYLLLRTDREKAEMDDAFDQPHTEDGQRGFSIRRSLSRAAGREPSASRQSLSSYNSRTTRASSLGRTAGGRVGTQRPGASHKSQSATTSPSVGPPSSPGSSGAAQTQSGRFSSLAGKFRSASGTRSSFSTARRGRSSISKSRQAGPIDPGDIYDASVVNDSAEDLRAVIERQEQEADRLENVRACCDGKHDVGSLTHRSANRRTSLGNRLGTHGHHHSNSLPLNDSVRSRV